MNLRIPAGLLRATRLVRRGKLLKATAAIHRAFHGYIGLRGRKRSRATVPAARVPGRFVTGTYSNRAGTREYKTYIPALYHGQALPLVVMLHGCKQNPDDFAAGTRMNVLAEEHGFMVVYPGQSRKANVSRCWNWFQAKHQRRDEGEPSLIAGITRAVMAAYDLDPHRVYVAGLSAGGAMAAIMGTTYPDLYSAVGIHSGLAYAAAHDATSAFAAMRGEESTRRAREHTGDASAQRVRTIVFHGDSDTTVHPNNGERVIAQASGEQAQPNVSSNSEATVENGNANGRVYTQTIYRDAAGKPVTEHWLVHGAAHAWSGGSEDGSYTDSEGPDASREMLRFFLGIPVRESVADGSRSPR